MNTPSTPKKAPQKPVAPPTIPERLAAIEQGIMTLDRMTIPRLVVGVNDELSKMERVTTALRRELGAMMEVVDTCVGLLGDDTVSNELQNRRTRRAMEADQRLQDLIISDLEQGKLEAEPTVRAAEGKEPGSLIVTQEYAEGSEDPVPGSYAARYMRDSLPEISKTFTGQVLGAEVIVPLKKNGQPLVNEKGEPRQNKVVLIGIYKQKALPEEGAPAEPTAPDADPVAPAEVQAEAVPAEAPAAETVGAE